ncbi:MAG: collagen-like protein [Thermoleophilia bacterium]|nr:collagen-like protein [Thermoleophilia bacterium]
MRLVRRLTYANVAATLALFFALGGTAVAGAKLLITGADVKNHSLTGVEIKDGSLGLKTLSTAARTTLKGNRGPRGIPGSTGLPGAAGPQGSAGPQGPPGAGVATASATGADVADYQNYAPLATAQLTVGGDYVGFTTFTVHNTGTESEYLNCGFRFDGNLIGAAGVDTTPGTTVTTTSVGAFNAPNSGSLEFLCVGNGNTTYDISDVEMRIHNLG